MATRKKIVPRKKISVAEQEELLNALQAKQPTEPESVETPVSTPPVQKRKRKKAVTQRVTVDFPQEMYEQMKELTEENGQTLRGFVVSLVRQHLAEQKK